MDKHCVSLDIAKQLKEAGWKKPTLFHYDSDDKESLVIQDKPRYSIDGFNAPLATEILEELPDIKILKDKIGCVVILKVNNLKSNHFEPDRSDKSLPNALAKMWLYLKKGGLLNA